MKIKKEDRSKIPPKRDIILEAVRVKIHNLPSLKAALGFNINYRALNDYCKKSCNYQP